jgi:anti-anti-sigma factor
MAEVQTTIQDIDIGGKTAKVVAFSGQLDETNVDSEAKKVYDVIDSMAEPNLLLDLENLTYMNSKSIGYVTDWYSRTAAKNGKIAIARPRPNILDILKVVGITQIIPIFETIDQAKIGLASAPSVA